MLSTGVECVSWTDHLSGRQTKLLSCPVVSVRDLKKLKIVKLNGHETEFCFFYPQGMGCVRAKALKVLKISGHRPFGYHGMRDNIKRATMLGSLLNELEFKA